MMQIPVVPENHIHVLAEFDCLDPLLSALRLDSGRLKCTCLAVSRKWLALGTSAGGIHLIQRDGWKQRLILTHKEGSITHIACCPHDEDFVAAATSQGLVVVWELQLERRGRPERVSMSWEHKGHNVTALCWDTNLLRVFVGDSGGKVTSLRAGSSKLGKGSAFVIFPVQTVTTVDSRVVQLGYQDGRLLVSSLSRCYLADTEREKFWRVGNKERDGEYGACFFPQNKGLLGQPPLLYCARPGSRIWEANFNGEVVSTHQFKQLLACPPLPLITFREEPHYSPEQRIPQSLAFSKLLSFGDQNLLTWTDSAIYIFTPQTGQLLLWTEVSDLVDIAVYRGELFCLHGNGRLTHLSLMLVDRCVERLLRRESWTLAAKVCCMFQHSIVVSRARKSVSMERLEQLKSQLSSSTDPELVGVLGEVITKLEPLDSASSSRRSSISSHESFNVLDCGIYRVISRRGSQSDEETSSLMNQSTSEEERLKEFNFAPEEDQPDHDPQGSDHTEADRSEQGLQFHLPLSFRSKPPRMALQAVKDSVSSFVKKTTEKINVLQMNSELFQRPEFKESAQAEAPVTTVPYLHDTENKVYDERHNKEADLQELWSATEQTFSEMQDPLVLLEPACMAAALKEWLPVLERILGPTEFSSATGSYSNPNVLEDEDLEFLSEQQSRPPEAVTMESELSIELKEQSEHQVTLQGFDSRELDSSCGSTSETIRLVSPVPIPSDLQPKLAELATLFLDLSCFGNQTEGPGCETFLRRYFFLLKHERVHKMSLLCFQEHPEIKSSFLQAMLELTQTDKVVEVIQRGDLLKSVHAVRELQPWKAPLVLTHLHRLYEKHGEAAIRSFPQFYPTITPADIMTIAQKSHFLSYLDSLIQSRPEEHQLSFLQSFLEPESLRQEWLELALTHDSPQLCDTLTPDGQPRWRSHYFPWGYGRLVSLLIHLPADLNSKQEMAEMCRSHGYWTGYLYLCNQLQHRTEAFSTICQLDDISLLEEPDGIEPRTFDDWKLLIQLSQQQFSSSRGFSQLTDVNGGSCSDGPTNQEGKITPESLTLMLARTAGPDRALSMLEECGVQVALSSHSKLVCELLRVTEKRQRAMIQTMLERCDRFLWSQHA